MSQQQNDGGTPKNSFNLEGRVKAVTPVEPFTSSKGKSYEKRRIVVDITTNPRFPTEVEIEFFAEELHRNPRELIAGDEVIVCCSVATRFGANGKGYTTVKGMYVRYLSKAPRQPEGLADPTHREAGKYTEEGVEEIPF